MDRIAHTKHIDGKSAPRHGGLQKEIFVDPSVVGLIVGQGGGSIKRVSEKYNVQIFVDKQSKEEKRRITIKGSTESDINAAIEEINL